MASQSPETNQAFLREVDEELRREQLFNIWRRWGRWIVVAAVVLLAAFAGWLYFLSHSEGTAGREGEAYDTALTDLAENQADKAGPELEKLTKASGAGYRAMALLNQGNVALQKNDMKTAAAKFGQVAADKSLPQPVRDLALIRQTSAEYDTLKPEQVIDRLKTLASPNSQWFGTAGEMVAIAYLKQGKTAEAGKLFGQIAGKEGVPDSIRQRAVQMAGVLGVDAIDQTEEKKAQ